MRTLRVLPRFNGIVGKRSFGSAIPDGVIRTPDERFQSLLDYSFAANYVTIQDSKVDLRMHYVDEGPRDGEIILCLHGQPTWSYLYRKVIPILCRAGYRVIAPDLIGFGKSDKLTVRSEYSYARHVSWMEKFIQSLELCNVTMVGQDWGGLIGLRLITQQPHLFSRIVVSNTGLPDAKDIPTGMAKPLRAMLKNVPALPAHEALRNMATNEHDTGFMYWIRHCDSYPSFSAGDIMSLSLRRHAESERNIDLIRAAYDAPFPSEEFQQGARQFPSLVPIFPDDPAIPVNKQAWRVLSGLQTPLLTCFTDKDPVTRGLDKRFQEVVPGARGQKHITITNAGHFVQEDAPGPMAAAIIDFCVDNPIGRPNA